MYPDDLLPEGSDAPQEPCSFYYNQAGQSIPLVPWNRCPSSFSSSSFLLILLNILILLLQVFLFLFPMLTLMLRFQYQGLQTEAFILMLHKLGFQLPADVGKVNTPSSDLQ